MGHFVALIIGIIAFVSLACQTLVKEGTITCHSEAISGISLNGKVLFTSCFDKFLRCFDTKVLLFFFTMYLLL